MTFNFHFPPEWSSLVFMVPFTAHLMVNIPALIRIYSHNVVGLFVYKDILDFIMV